jgi:sugar transferase (PEP-CTERM/EpsH1 system associated)
MKKLLFLTHRFPYPANKGDKIRALNILEHLSATHEVFLGCVDGDAAGEAPIAWATGRGFHLYCGASSQYGRLPRTAWSLLRGEPLSNGYFWHGGLGRWVAHVLETERPELIYVFSSAMAQYVRKRPSTSHLIMDFVDVDSVKWKQYADTRRAPFSWLYGLEARRLLRHDREVARVADVSLFVSTAELELFRSIAPEAASHAYAVPNGVDTAYFTATSRPPASGQIVFVGVMDYWPNVEAVQWFATEVLPLIVKHHPAAKFKIVGSKPTAAVRELASNPAIEVTGAVDDIRPFLNAARVVVTPLRIARGIQNKVLEGMAMGRPVVTTPQALEGIPAEDGVHALVARTPEAFCNAVVRCLEEAETARIGERAREFVVSRFSWASQLKSLDVILAGLA